MCRGNNGQEIFCTDDGRRLFLATLDEVCTQTEWCIHAYVLMSNHYHLLMETPEPNLVEGMRWFQSTYTQRFNAMFQRRGHLYQGRYKAIPVQTDPRHGGLEYFKKISTYIHLNPFRAQLCGEGCSESLQSYRWSSYPYYTGRYRKRPDWLVREKVFQVWGLQEGDADTHRSYRQALERKMKCSQNPEAGRQGEFEKQVKHGWFIGSEAFRSALEPYLQGKEGRDTLRGAQRRDHGVAEAERLIQAGLKALHLSEQEIVESKAVRIEKQALVWLLKSYTTVRVIWIAERLRMGHPVNASRAISRFNKEPDRETKQLKEKMIKCAV
jgi:REP element-mobilizing transposase RayT